MAFTGKFALYLGDFASYTVGEYQTKGIFYSWSAYEHFAPIRPGGLGKRHLMDWAGRRDLSDILRIC